MKDIILKPKIRKESEILFLNQKNLSDDGKHTKNEILTETSRQIRNVYSTKTRKISLDENQDFYDEFLTKLFEEEKTDCHSYITTNAKVSPNRSNIKPTKKINIKSREISSNAKHRSNSPNLILNTIVEKVFENRVTTTEDKNRLQNKHNKIRNILHPLYESKTHQEKINKVSSHYHNKKKNHNQYYKCLSEQKKIDKDEQHCCFWNKIMCCLAFSNKHTS